MVKCKVATVISTIKTFGKYTDIRTNVTFNKNVIKAIENNKPLKRSIRNILHKYERTEIANCIYCGSSTNSKRIAILTERVCKDEEANLALEDQKKVAKSIVRLLEADAKRMNNNEVRRSITRIFKNDRKFQVYTKFILSLEERKVILTKGFSIDEFILELINDYKYEECESLTFKKEMNFISAFECEIELISFVENAFYNKRLAVVNRHKRVVELAEKTLLEWKRKS
jgi:hypothetical protein